MPIKEMWTYMKKFFQMIRRDHPSILFSVIIGGIASATIPFVVLVYSAKILDALLEANMNLAKKQIVILLLATFIIGIIERICYHAMQVVANTAHFSVLKQTAYKAYVVEYEEFEKTETMDKIRRTQSGSNGSGGVETQINLSYDFVAKVTAVMFSVIYTLQLFWKCFRVPVFRIYTLILAILFVFFMKTISIILKKVGEAEVKVQHDNEHGNSLSSYILNSAMDVQNGKDIRLYKMKNLIQTWYQKMTCDIKKKFTLFAVFQGKSSGLIAFLTQIFAGCVYIYVGASALAGIISIGNILLYASCITRLTDELSNLIQVYSQIAYRFEYLGYFEEFINQPNMHYDGTLPIEKREDYEYEFEFRNVSFKYPGTENYVLKNVNLKFDINKRFAVVGQNGAGKTTLVKLLCRLYEPTEGEILLNGINIEKYDYAEYTSIFSVVFQDFKLFPLPLDENIAGSSQVDEKLCMDVVEKVGLKETVMSWPEKQKTRLYKNLGDGINVSGGEAQKIAIARALYKDAPFVIMDEPTAALDPIAESEIYENFNDMIHDKTALFISHRMSSCKFCDEIVVFENGEIVQRGAHEQLVEQKGLYQELWNAQAQYYA